MHSGRMDGCFVDRQDTQPMVSKLRPKMASATPLTDKVGQGERVRASANEKDSTEKRKAREDKRGWLLHQPTSQILRYVLLFYPKLHRMELILKRTSTETEDETILVLKMLSFIS